MRTKWKDQKAEADNAYTYLLLCKKSTHKLLRHYIVLSPAADLFTSSSSVQNHKQPNNTRLRLSNLTVGVESNIVVSQMLLEIPWRI